jgi:Neutral/alkaline non-lysosomal ceramidase, N-terminal
MSSKPSSYKAGAASVCITPEEPLWLAGYAVRTEPPCGKLSDLHANALVLEDGTGQRFVVASAEIIAINREIAGRVAEAVRARHGLSRRQLLLTATHTHYAPEYRAEKQLFFHIPTEYAAKFPVVADKFVAALTQAIDQAFSRLEPVRLFARKTTAGFAHNRRRRGVVAGTPSPEDVVDQDVPVLDCVDAAGQRKAIVFGYACHCTTIPPEDLRYCGDWAGFAMDRLQRANAGATALFVPGCGADQDPEPRASVELSRQYGRELALAVEESLSGPGVEITGAMRVGWDDVRLAIKPVTRDAIDKMLNSDDPPQRVKARFLLESLDRGETPITCYDAPLQVVRFGDELLLIALSGEPVVDWAHKLRREFERGATSRPEAARQIATSLTAGGALLPSGYPIVWVAGYCNDVFDYLPTRRIQTERGYEGGRANLWNWIPAPFTDDVEDRITIAVRRLVGRVCK